jgi:hypothetical protein
MLSIELARGNHGQMMFLYFKQSRRWFARALGTCGRILSCFPHSNFETNLNPTCPRLTGWRARGGGREAGGYRRDAGAEWYALCPVGTRIPRAARCGTVAQTDTGPASPPSVQ